MRAGSPRTRSARTFRPPSRRPATSGIQAGGAIRRPPPFRAHGHRMSEQTAPDAPIHARTVPATDEGAPRGIAGTIRALELDLRLIGMIVVLVAIWIVFDLFTGGRFITPRNL